MRSAMNVLDDYHRQGLRIEIEVSLTAARIIRVLEQLIAVRGRPQRLRVDNGPEFTSGLFRAWCEAQDIELEFIQPGKPNQNGFIERCNGSYREEVIDTWLFRDLAEVRWSTTRPYTNPESLRFELSTFQGSLRLIINFRAGVSVPALWHSVGGLIGARRECGGKA